MRNAVGKYKEVSNYEKVSKATYSLSGGGGC